MALEEKELLLKDLCGRLPHGVMCRFSVKDVDISITEKLDLGGLEHFIYGTMDVKPYLRPMSSMTEGEFESLKEYSGLKYDQLDLASYQNGTYKCLDFYLSEVPSYVVILVFDWLNEHHFDYRGLITMDLAIEAPEGMYKND